MNYTADQLEGLLHSEEVFGGRRVVVLCDGKCEKAWGISQRPRVILSNDEDDFYYVPDGELGTAPIDPGTYEGDHGKPDPGDGSDRINKWCVRECERSSILNPRRDQFRRPHNFQRPRYNLAERQREADKIE